MEIRLMLLQPVILCVVRFLCLSILVWCMYSVLRLECIWRADVDVSLSTVDRDCFLRGIHSSELCAPGKFPRAVVD